MVLGALQRLVVAGLSLATALWAQGGLPDAAAPEERSLSVPRVQLLRAASLGFESLAADYYWLRAVQLVGGDRGNSVRYAHLIGRLTAAVTALDPWVDHPYRFAALWMSEDSEEVESANRLLERGIAYHPQEWRNRFYLGFNYLFYLGDADAAARELAPAIRLPGAPAYLGRLLARLRSSASGDLDAADAFLQTLLEQDDLDVWHRTAYEDALVEIETERRARQLDEARARFVAENGFDIRRVEELAWGPYAVLWTLPAEPNGAGWEIDDESGRIVSRHYERRYRVHFQDPTQRLKGESSDREAGRGAE
ncbi:MAG: hypothetical protein OZ948_12880 [Deltaproteobacteria bacterium]|nr:hypothetical protein [Deltaproteobacteria bacterium]